MRRFLLIAIMSCALSNIYAQSSRDAVHLVPNGKGWGDVAPNSKPPKVFNPPKGAAKGNGILYHGGPIMPATPNLYFVWYGNFVTGPAPSDSVMTQDLIATLFGRGGLGGTPWARINTTYSDKTRSATGNFVLADSTNDYYSRGKTLSDSSITTIVSSAISTHALPKDTNGIYFVLTSSDVTESSGFCTKYCGWHSNARIAGADIKIAFVGNPDRCPTSCLEQVVSPNGDSGADGMASVIAHETQEAISDADLNGWYDTAGNENADKCAWKWGPVTGILGNGAYNMTVAGHHWLIQMNWENARGGGCDQKLAGKFYLQ